MTVDRSLLFSIDYLTHSVEVKEVQLSSRKAIIEHEE